MFCKDTANEESLRFLLPILQYNGKKCAITSDSGKM